MIRIRLLPVLGLVAATTVAAALGWACGGEAYGSCVTVYTDGDVYRYDTDKAYCEETCVERMQESSVIASCYFDGSRAAPVEP